MDASPTFIRDRWSGDDYVRIVLIFKPLAEHIHVQRAEEPEPASLSEGS